MLQHQKDRAWRGSRSPFSREKWWWQSSGIIHGSIGLSHFLGEWNVTRTIGWSISRSHKLLSLTEDFSWHSI
jgi:hypothetical protein